MKSLHLTIMIFCHVLLASVVLYLTTYAIASPLSGPTPPKPEAPTLSLKSDVLQSPQKQVAESKLDNKRSSESKLGAKSSLVAPAEKISTTPTATKSAAEPFVAPEVQLKKSPTVEQPSVAKVEPKVEAKSELPALKNAEKTLETKPVDVIPPLTERKVPEIDDIVHKQPITEPAKAPEVVKVAENMPAALVPRLALPSSSMESEPVPSVKQEKPHEPTMRKVAPVTNELEARKMPAMLPVGAPLVDFKTIVTKDEMNPSEGLIGKMAEPMSKVEVVKVDSHAAVKKEHSPESLPVAAGPANKAPVAPVPVKGGLGPLHLLAATLCNYQPEKPVADETLNDLYRRRAVVRKSLFEFMSLKFTNLEKLSSRLGDSGGLAVVPVKTVDQASKSNIVPSHGWPLVGKCTAHDLRLMGEAAWCDVEASQSATGVVEDVSKKVAQSAQTLPTARVGAARAMVADAQVEQPVRQQSVDSSAVISKILRVGDVKDAQTIENSIGNLNLTQQQLATIQAQAASTRECRRNALRYTKAIFNHLAEDQKNVSESWPKLYAQISDDECARRRMIDIITALSGFRSDTTSVRRDNLEFAFAMDDLRGKVLENEVNIPLNFDRQFIEVEQFLQQSVQLMLANIDPERAKITSARYRSLMSGPTAPDDQCIELHQRLMARNYPTDCNPTQFGQLPDVLRMTAHSLELWSIEKELSQRSAKLAECANYQQQQQQLAHNRLQQQQQQQPQQVQVQQQQQQQTQPQALVNPVLPQQPAVNKESVDECIASLVTS